MKRAFTWVEVFMAAFVVLTLAFFMVPALRTQRSKANFTKCAGNIRSLALAAVQYGDSKRFLPHVSGPGSLDGDIGSSDTPTAVRALVWFGYHDGPEAFVCPSSRDLALPIQSAAVRDNMRLWAWEGRYAQPGSEQALRSPFEFSAQDPALEDSLELSYALTRRGLDRNVSSLALLGADRSLRLGSQPMEGLPRGHWGNHRLGWNVIKADATVELVEAERTVGARSAHDCLTGTAPGEGCLPLSDVAIPSAP